MTITVEDILSVNPNHDFDMDTHLALLKSVALNSPLVDLVDSILHIEVKMGGLEIYPSEENIDYIGEYLKNLFTDFRWESPYYFVRDVNNEDLLHILQVWLYLNPKLKFDETYRHFIQSLNYREGELPKYEPGKLYDMKIGGMSIKELTKLLRIPALNYTPERAAQKAIEFDPSYNLADVYKDEIIRNYEISKLKPTKEWKMMDELLMLGNYYEISPFVSKLNIEFRDGNTLKSIKFEPDVSIPDSLLKFYNISLINDPIRIL